jgi:serine/threonine protein kinase
VAFGSPGYAPPEQYGKSQTTVQSDIFALGVMLHQLLTGVDPSVKPFTFPSIRSLNPAVPVDLEKLVTRMVQLDASNRPASTELVHQELQQIARSLGETEPIKLSQRPMPTLQKTYPDATLANKASVSRPRHHRSTVGGYITNRTLRILAICSVVIGLIVGLVVVCSHTPQLTQSWALDTAQQRVQDDVSAINQDLTSLADDSNLGGSLADYKVDWNQMQKDYQLEIDDYRQGCGINGNNVVQVGSDAVRVDSDLIAINSDDISFGTTVNTLNSDLPKVQSDLAEIQADLQQLHSAMANSNVDPSVAATLDEGSGTLANAQQQFDSASAALQSAQSQSTQYDQKAAKMDAAARNLADGMQCY